MTTDVKKKEKVGRDKIIKIKRISELYVYYGIKRKTDSACWMSFDQEREYTH